MVTMEQIQQWMQALAFFVLPRSAVARDGTGGALVVEALWTFSQFPRLGQDAVLQRTRPGVAPMVLDGGWRSAEVGVFSQRSLLKARFDVVGTLHVSLGAC